MKISKGYGLVIDLERCIGCQACRLAWKFENDWDKGSGIRVDTAGSAHPNTPSGKYMTLIIRHCDDLIEQ